MNNPTKEVKVNLRRMRIMKKNNQGGEKSNQNNQRRQRNRRDDDLGGIKIEVPSFQGKSDPKAYLEWEMHVDQIFLGQNYSKGQKVKIATLEFTDYAFVCWDQVQKEIARYEERLVRTWEETKAITRRRFVPSYFHRELNNKLQCLSQGSRSNNDSILKWTEP
ncbi:hypothetical protein CR513_34662, partial [Mucuna pruriens]